MTNKPIHKMNFGRIRVAIWENEARESKVYSVTLTRTYKDGDTFKDTTSLGRDDLLVASKALELAYCWIVKHQNLSE